jgi:hypothetical protein
MHGNTEIDGKGLSGHGESAEFNYLNSGEEFILIPLY